MPQEPNTGDTTESNGPGIDREPLRVVVLSASLRQASLNHQLARLAVLCAEAHGARVGLHRLSKFSMPLYDQDAQDTDGFPPAATALRQLVVDADAMVIASPEYNASLPGVLKNAIDWLSRFRPQPFNGRHCLLLSASPSMTGGSRGLWSLRIPLEHLGTRVYPDMFALAQANKGFDERGGLTSTELHDRLDQTIVGFLDLAEAATHYTTMKRAWIEFLGERPDPRNRLSRPLTTAVESPCSSAPVPKKAPR